MLNNKVLIVETAVLQSKKVVKKLGFCTLCILFWFSSRPVVPKFNFSVLGHIATKLFFRCVHMKLIVIHFRCASKVNEIECALDAGAYELPKAAKERATCDRLWAPSE